MGGSELMVDIFSAGIDHGGHICVALYLVVLAYWAMDTWKARPLF